jgi:glutathione S-transferase
MNDQPIRLHQLPPLDRTPSLSPFCMKVESYLRMAGLAYEVVVVLDARNAPTGKLPFIEDRGQAIGDSGLILEHLATTRNAGVDSHLSPGDHAVGHALRRMLEEHFYWALVFSRWYDDAHWQRLRSVFLGHLPGALRLGLGVMARTLMTRAMRAHGIGRHTREQIFAAGSRDLESLSLVLAEREFLFGATPSSYDAIAHAFVANLLNVDMQTPLRDAARAHPNLVRFNERMNARYYADQPWLARRR